MITRTNAVLAIAFSMLLSANLTNAESHPPWSVASGGLQLASSSVKSTDRGASDSSDLSLRLVIRGEDAAHLSKSFEEMLRLKRSGITVDEVVIVGSPWNPTTPVTSSGSSGQSDAAVARYRAVYQQFKLYGLSDPALVDTQSAVLAVGAEYSPFWQVSVVGEVYTYQGVASLRSYFSARGEFLFKPSVSRPNAQKFSASSKRAQMTSALNANNFFGGIEKAKSTLPSYQLRLARPNQALASRSLSRCSGERKRYEPSLNTEAQNNFDITVYDRQNSNQHASAERLNRRTVAYDLQEPIAEQSEQLLQFIGVQCLPTRVRKVIHQGKPQLEFLEGESALN